MKKLVSSRFEFEAYRERTSIEGAGRRARVKISFTVLNGSQACLDIGDTSTELSEEGNALKCYLRAYFVQTFLKILYLRRFEERYSNVRKI